MTLKNGSGGSLALIFDTHALVWFGNADPRFSAKARGAIEAPGARLCVSAVTAWEYADLRVRKRIPQAAAFEALHDMLVFEVLDFPGEAWLIALDLPDIHRDPVDRMLVAHAIVLDMTLVTADRTLSRYPVKTLW